MMNLREINWFVAEKVMNWHVWENEDGELMVTKGYGCYSHCPSFSTNIADAWKVVEKLIDNGYNFNIYNHNKEFNVEINLEENDEHLWFYGEADFAPLAICIAALQTVGVEVEVNEQ